MVTPLMVKAPLPAPPSETAVPRPADVISEFNCTVPSAVLLVIVSELVLELYNPADWRKLLVSVSLPNTMGLLLDSVISSEVEL